MKALTSNELKKLQQTLDKLERNIKRDYGLQKISGGFCTINMTNYTDKTIELECIVGTQNDTSSEEDVFYEDLIMDRETFELIN